jgi:hypothetical protein
MESSKKFEFYNQATSKNFILSSSKFLILVLSIQYRSPVFAVVQLAQQQRDVF